MAEEYLQTLEAARVSLAGIAERRKPRVGVVLGSGLGGVVDAAEDVEDIPFADIPGIPTAGVLGHAGVLSFCRLGGAEAIVTRGRIHLYEGHAPQVVAHPVRLMARLGIEMLVLTNAAGSLVPWLSTGDIMCLSDHINLTGTSPLLGPNADELGERFPVMANAYDPGLRTLALEVASEYDIDLKVGVYAGVLGPAFETPAEVVALARLGADAVGMSTVLETIAARHMGVRVAGFSLVTNAAGSHGDGGHEAVLAAGEAGAERMATLVTGLVAAFGRAT